MDQGSWCERATATGGERESESEHRTPAINAPKHRDRQFICLTARQPRRREDGRRQLTRASRPPSPAASSLFSGDPVISLRVPLACPSRIPSADRPLLLLPSCLRVSRRTRAGGLFSDEVIQRRRVSRGLRNPSSSLSASSSVNGTACAVARYFTRSECRCSSRTSLPSS